MKKILAIMAAGLAVLATSCQDENDLNSGSKTQSQSSFTSSTDITFGKNVLIYGQDTLNRCNIPVASDSPVKITSGGDVIRLTCTRNEDGVMCLVPSLSTRQDTTVMQSFHISVPEQKGRDKDISVVIHPRTMMTRAVTDDYASPEAIHDCLTEKFAYGFIMGFLPGEQVPVYKVFNPQALGRYVEQNNAFSKGGYTIEAYGTSMEEMTHDWALKASCSFPVGSFPVVANIGVQTKSHSSSTHSYEYATIECAQQKAFGVICDSLVNHLTANDHTWSRLLDSGLNEYLNNAYVGANKQFDLDSAGTVNLIKTYGTHISTQLLLGGSCRYEVSKTMDLTVNSFEVSVNASASQSASSTMGMKSGDSAEDKYYLARAFKNLGGKTYGGSLEFSNMTQKVSQTSSSEDKINYIGSGSFENGHWQVSDKARDWAVLGTNANKNSNTVRYIPLYELIDKDALKNENVKKRYDMLKYIIEHIDADGYPAYMHAYGPLPTKNDKPGNYVVCDFMYKFEDSANGEPFVGQVTNKEGKTVDVMYYPMRWNDACSRLSSASSDWSYKTFDALKDAFVSLGRSSGKYQHFYYAMLPETESYGIDAITFVPLESNEGTIFASSHNRGDDYARDGWTRRTMGGKTCGDGVVSASADKVVPYVHYRDAKSSSLPISAVCLFNEDNIVMSTSAGTEYDPLNQLSSRRFKEYWQDCSLCRKNTKDESTDTDHWYSYRNTSTKGLNQADYYYTASNCAYSWYRCSFYVHQNNYIYVGYSYRPLEMTEKVNNKSQPVKALLPDKY